MLRSEMRQQENKEQKTSRPYLPEVLLDTWDTERTQYVCLTGEYKEEYGTVLILRKPSLQSSKLSVTACPSPSSIARAREESRFRENRNSGHLEDYIDAVYRIIVLRWEAPS